ncbi:MAG: redoxin domain-containing protein [Pseudomonadota bacterium]
MEYFGIATIVLTALIAAWWWKQRGNSAVNPAIATGALLPDFDCELEDGSVIHSQSLRGKRAVILFVRGSWCPFCSEQVQSLTDHYRQISESGGKLVIITRRPLETTKRVAEQFDVAFDFWLDKSLAAATKLDLVDQQDIPERFQEDFGRRTILPTVLVVDEQGVIRYSYRSPKPSDRPDPVSFMSVFNALG